MPQRALVELGLIPLLQRLARGLLRPLEHLVQRNRALMRSAPPLGLEAVALDRLLQFRFVERYRVAELGEKRARVLPARGVGGPVGELRALAIFGEVTSQLLDLGLFRLESARA